MNKLNEQLGWSILTVREADSGIESINNTDFELGGCQQFCITHKSSTFKWKLSHNLGLNCCQSAKAHHVWSLVFLDFCDLHYLTSLRYKYGGRGLWDINKYVANVNKLKVDSSAQPCIIQTLQLISFRRTKQQAVLTLPCKHTDLRLEGLNIFWQELCFLCVYLLSTDFTRYHHTWWDLLFPCSVFAYWKQSNTLYLRQWRPVYITHLTNWVPPCYICITSPGRHLCKWYFHAFLACSSTILSILYYMKNENRPGNEASCHAPLLMKLSYTCELSFSTRFSIQSAILY